jgi:hypothetical protein
VTTVGFGKYVVAIVYGLVGFKGVFVFAVIFVPGYFCIGAYLIGPVCAVQGSAKLPLPAAATVPPAPTAAFIRAGPAVPVTDFAPAITFAGNVPVMPLREKRGEKLVTVPPVEATDMTLRKLR